MEVSSAVKGIQDSAHSNIALMDKTDASVQQGVELVTQAGEALQEIVTQVMLWVAPLYTLFSIPAFGHPADATLLETWKSVSLGLFTDHLWFLLVLFWITLFWIIALWILQKLGRDTALTGGMVALVAALCLQNYGGWLKWYCLWEAPSFILCYYMGIVAFRNHEALNALCRTRPLALGLGLTALIVLLWPYASAPVSGWIVSLLCALLVYHMFLLTAGLYPLLQAFAPFAWFERNGFRFYLFHLPTPLLVFMRALALGLSLSSLRTTMMLA